MLAGMAWSRTGKWPDEAAAVAPLTRAEAEAFQRELELRDGG